MPRVCKRWFPNGGSSFVRRSLSATPFLPQFNPLFTSVYLFLTSSLPLFNLNLTSASSGISNHFLETTVYKPLDLLRWHVCRANFARKIFFFLELLELSYEGCSENFPDILSLYSVGQKNPAKFPPNFPAKNQKNSPTSFCRSAGRTFGGV